MRRDDNAARIGRVSSLQRASSKLAIRTRAIRNALAVAIAGPLIRRSRVASVRAAQRLFRQVHGGARVVKNREVLWGACHKQPSVVSLHTMRLRRNRLCCNSFA